MLRVPRAEGQLRKKRVIKERKRKNEHFCHPCRYSRRGGKLFRVPDTFSLNFTQCMKDQESGQSEYMEEFSHAPLQFVPFAQYLPPQTLKESSPCEIIENTYTDMKVYVSASGAWHRTPNTHVISYMIGAQGASFVLMRQCWVGSWKRVGQWKNQAMMRILEFSAPSPFSRV